MSLDLAQPIRDSLLATDDVVNSLPAYVGGYPIFTRRPVPADAPYPMVVISSDVNIMDNDGVDDRRPIVIRDIITYGRNDSPEDYRTVEEIAYAVRTNFHGNRTSIDASPEYGVIDVIARGPRPAPTDDEQTVGRLVELTIRLAKLG